MKKLIPALITLLGLALVIAAIVVWLEPPEEGGVFSVTGGVISFLAGLGVSIKGWNDLFKKDEPANTTRQELNNHSETSTPIQAQNVNIYHTAPATGSLPKNIDDNSLNNFIPLDKSANSKELGDMAITSISWEYRDSRLLKMYFERCKEYEPVFFATIDDNLITTREYLLSSGLVARGQDGQFYLTQAGVLLCCQQIYLPRYAYHVHVKFKQQSGEQSLNEELFGSVLYLYYQLYDRLKPLFERRMGSPDIRDAFGSEKIFFEYPETAIVEALANFLVHRDYLVDDQAFITIYPDHVEFINPGKSDIPPEDLLNATSALRPTSSKRNPRLIEAMNKARFNQNEGSGIVRIIKVLENNGSYMDSGKPGLTIENDVEKNRFKLVIYKRAFLPKPEKTVEYLKYTLPSQPYFFGRSSELITIAAAISPDSRTWGALIDGPGGIGKTALAIKAAHDAPAELFERKIFITAKVRELTAEGEAKLTDFTRPTYLDMLDELGKELGADGLEKLAPDERPNELRLALAGKKALIIFDNLETLPEEERTRLFQFLSRLPEGNKAIVTSRRRSDVDARIVRLDRLAHNEAQQLIAELAAKYPRLARASQEEREGLYEITQGNPLFIRWIAGQLGREGSQIRTITEAFAFIDKAPNGNDPLEYIFGDLLETFTADETKVLAALTYFNLPAKLNWIAEMADLPARAAETALEDLTDRSILTSGPSVQTYFLPPLTAKFIRTRRPKAVTETGDALTDRTYALVMQYGGHTSYEGFPTLEAEWNFISAALPRLLTGDNDRLQAFFQQLGTFLEFTGRWDELIWMCEQAEARALSANDKENAGWLAYRAGWAYSRRNQPTEVLACAARVAEHWQDRTSRNKAIAINLRGVGNVLNQDYPAAITAYREALEIYRSISPESNDVASTLNSLAGAERENKDYPAAERDYREALRIAKIIKNNEYIATFTGNLAELALDREQWAEAESLAREALVLAEKVGRQELIANDCHRIAQALVRARYIVPQPSQPADGVGAIRESPLQEALSLARRAVEIYTRLRSSKLQKAQETLAEIERAMQKAE